MKLAIMQPYFLPYIGYWQLLNAVDKFVIYDDVNYINKGWINRNRILVNNEAYTFTVPLREASQNKLISEIELEYNSKWKNKLLKTISLTYKRASNFNEVFPIIESIIRFEETNLSKFILNSLRTLCEFLDINTVLVPSSIIYANGHLRASEKILDICQKEQAKIYINPIGGIELYDYQEFSKNQIQLNFLKPEIVTYEQFGKPFVPGLSILDLIMFKSKEEVKADLLNFSLV